MQIKSDRIVFPDNTEQFTAGGGSGGGSVETVDAPAFSASLSAPASMSNTGWTKVPFSVVEYDTENSFDTTNNRFNPSVAGYYKLTFNARFNGNVKSCFGAVYLNGAEKVSTYNSSEKLATTLLVEGTVYLNGTTDYVEAFVFHGSDTPLDLSNSLSHTYFQGVLVKPANSGTLVGGEPVTLDALGIPNHDKVTVDANGAVGIGYDTPSKWSVTNGKSLVVGKNNDNTALQGKMVISQRDDLAVGGSQGASIGAVFGENPIRSASIDFGCMGGSGQSGRITFNTKAENDDTTLPTERMRIDANGNVMLGTNTKATFEATLNVFSPSTKNTGLHLRTDTTARQSQIIFGNSQADNCGSIETLNGTCQMIGFTTRASDVYFSDDEDNPRQGKSLKETLADRDKIIDKLLAKVEALEEKLKKVK